MMDDVTPHRALLEEFARDPALDATRTGAAVERVARDESSGVREGIDEPVVG